MKLKKLLEGLPEKEVLGSTNVEVGGISYDSRRTQLGHLFVAIPGFHVDGHQFIHEAIAKGASAIVAQRNKAPEGLAPEKIPLVLVPDSRRALAHLSAAFYHYPSHKLRVIGVTGTDGKTTTTHLISAVLEQAGYRTGLLGTVNFKIGQNIWANDSHQTTPESPEIQDMLARMVRDGVNYAIIESSSHGLALERVAMCDYDVAVFTNLTSDHLDFHQTREEYLRQKAKLFSMLGAGLKKGIPKVGILNADDEASAFLRPLCPEVVISYGIEKEAEVRAKDIKLSGWATTFTAVTPLGEIALKLKLPGHFNVYNSLAALATGVSQKVDLITIKRGLEAITGVPGRMERIDFGQPFTVIVDYAHNAHSLEKMLRTLRPFTKGRLIVVFGCPGERDRARRSGMGQGAGRLADFAILTNDDPRSEDPEAILDEIAMAMESVGRRLGEDYLRIPDRREAIQAAIGMAMPGDVVLIAGKGHEQCMLMGNETIPWDDRQVAREVLKGVVSK